MCVCGLYYIHPPRSRTLPLPLYEIAGGRRRGGALPPSPRLRSASKTPPLTRPQYPYPSDRISVGTVWAPLSIIKHLGLCVAWSSPYSAFFPSDLLPIDILIMSES